ncbi:hypothetical protein PV326_008613 [Microctonus aethiopoides]|nr:hypothetical protein PV326_008613 [Microctonus aethiopoides]
MLGKYVDVDVDILVVEVGDVVELVDVDLVEFSIALIDLNPLISTDVCSHTFYFPDYMNPFENKQMICTVLKSQLVTRCGRCEISFLSGGTWQQVASRGTLLEVSRMH